MADETKTTTASAPLADPNQPATQKYRLLEGFSHVDSNRRELAAGEEVELTQEQFSSLRDRFVPVLQTSEGTMPSTAAAAVPQYEAALSESQDKVIEFINSGTLETQAQMAELIQTEIKGKNRPKVLEAANKKLASLK